MADGRGGRLRRAALTRAGLLPFVLWTLLFLAIPTALAIGTGFVDAEGSLTGSNLAALTDPTVLRTFWASIWLSAITAVVGAVVGALVCYALLGTRPASWLRSIIDAASGVLAQFGGVMLAFAFIATVGTQGLVTLRLGWGPGDAPFFASSNLYTVAGLMLPYLYFQVPLMVITFLPALEGLRPQWAEANATLGGTRWTFWTRIGLPVLAPSFLGSLLLLFANSFSSYATAAALISQGSQIVPLQIRTALTSETVLGQSNLAGALALGMTLVMVVVMSLYAVLMRRAARWQR